MIPRMMASASVFLIPFIALGVGWTMQRLEFSDNLLRRLSTVFIVFSVFVPLLSYGYLVVKDGSTDTRVSAAKWISSNIEKNVVVGINEFCSGESPARVAGNAVIVDPPLAQNLEYYVLISY